MGISPELSKCCTRKSDHGIARYLVFVGVLAVSAVTSQRAIAQQWQIEPSLELVGTYTDNLYLAVDVSVKEKE